MAFFTSHQCVCLRACLCVCVSGSVRGSVRLSVERTQERGGACVSGVQCSFWCNSLCADGRHKSPFAGHLICCSMANTEQRTAHPSALHTSASIVSQPCVHYQRTNTHSHKRISRCVCASAATELGHLPCGEPHTHAASIPATAHY